MEGCARLACRVESLCRRCAPLSFCSHFRFTFRLLPGSETNECSERLLEPEGVGVYISQIFPPTSLTFHPCTLSIFVTAITFRVSPLAATRTELPYSLLSLSLLSLSLFSIKQQQAIEKANSDSNDDDRATARRPKQSCLLCPSWQLAKLIDSSKRATATATATSTSTESAADADNDVVAAAAADVDDDAANLVIAGSVE